MEGEVPAPESTWAGDEDAVAAAAAQTAPMEVVPVVEMPAEEVPEMGASRWLEDLREIASNAAPDTVGTIADIASTSEGCLGAGPSDWAIIQPEVTSDFVRTKREEDDVWQAQLDVGAQIEADITRALQLHMGENFRISHISASPATYPFLTVFIWHPLMSFCSQQLMQMSRDKSM